MGCCECLHAGTKLSYHRTMKISVEELKKLCAKRGLSLNRLLNRAGVSKNAYYSLVCKGTVLPGSVMRIAALLGVKASTFLTETEPEEASIQALLEDLETIVGRNKRVDRDNVRHTLLLLQEEPIERLRRALTRGRQLDLHG